MENSKIGKCLELLNVSKFLNPNQIAIEFSVEVLPSALQLSLELPLCYCWSNVSVVEDLNFLNFKFSPNPLITMFSVFWGRQKLQPWNIWLFRGINDRITLENKMSAGFELLYLSGLQSVILKLWMKMNSVLLLWQM